VGGGLAVENHGHQHRGAERAAHELQDPGGAAGVRHLLPAQPTEGAGHDRDRRGAEPGAADDQGRAEQPVAGMQPGQRERDRADGGQRDAGQDDEPGADLVGQPAGQRARGNAAEALRDHQQASRERGVVPDLLEVQRQQQHRPVDREPGQEQQGARPGEPARSEQPEVDHGRRGRPQRVHAVGREQHDAGAQRDDHPAVGEAAVGAHLGQAVQQPHQRRRQQHQPDQVDARCAALRPRRRQVPPGEHQPGQAHRHVHVEDPAPADVADDQPGHHRPEDRDDDNREADRGHQPPQLAAADRLHEQRGDQRGHHAAADALDHPERDQAADVPRGAAGDRSGQEQGQREHPHGPPAEPGQRPAAQRDDHGEREQVAGDHPLDGGHGGVQVPADRVDGHVDDRGVEQRRDRAGEQDDDELDHGWVQALAPRLSRGSLAGLRPCVHEK
jgi:hypothetical protein